MKIHRLPPRFLQIGFSLLLGASLSACGGGDRFDPIELNIAHLNDHHSQLEPFSNVELSLVGVPTRVSLGGFARQTTVFKSLAGTPNLLKLHAGDAITGSLYYTFFKGQADARMMNTICFDAFVPGNHEFDDSDAALKTLLDELANPLNGACGTPTVSSNVVPQAGTPLAVTTGEPLLKPYFIKKIAGVDVGIIGITIAGKTTQSSRPLSTTAFQDEVTAAQKAIDALKAKGVRHIVALTHQGYEADKAMVAQLTDVDVVIGGDSHSLLGDFSSVGINTASGAYPTVVTNKSGETVCIGQAWEYAKAYGLMNIKFNDRGAVSQCSGQAKLVIGDSFQRKDSTGAWVAVSDNERAQIVAALDGHASVKVASADSAAAQALAGFTAQVDAQKAITIGSATDALCLVRTPGESTNRSAATPGCESANTLARGSDVAQVVAEAFLRASRRADFALQNAGGVRTPVAAGNLSMNTAFTLLPFTNVLWEMELTGAQVRAALEDGVSTYLDAGQSTGGSHPYAAGLRWELDMSQPKGQRFANVQVRNKSTGVWAPIDPAANYVLVTNDFIGVGQDGYTTLGDAYRAGRYVNTYLLYTQSFVDHVKAVGTLQRPAAGDYSHQKVVTQDGVLLP